jgi:hypothetical protein
MPLFIIEKPEGGFYPIANEDRANVQQCLAVNPLGDEIVREIDMTGISSEISSSRELSGALLNLSQMVGGKEIRKVIEQIAFRVWEDGRKYVQEQKK